MWCVLSVVGVSASFWVGNGFPVFDENDITTWTRVDMKNLDNPATQALVAEKRHVLATQGAFKISDMLAEPILERFRASIMRSERVNRKAHRTIFQDKGDPNYSEKAPRNAMFTNCMDFVPRRNIEKESPLFRLYEWPPFLAFVRAIAGTDELYLSNDIDGSVYGFVGEKGDWFAWHFDEHPFSCVWMLRRPEEGGYLQHTYMKMEKEPEVADKFRNARPWDRLGRLFDGDEEEVSKIRKMQAQEGDMYCFWGNVSLHEIVEIKSDKGRAASIFAYAPVPDFAHTKHVYEMNDWGKEAKPEL